MRFYLHVIFNFEREVSVNRFVFQGFSQFGKFFDVASPVENNREMELILDKTVRALIVEEHDRLSKTPGLIGCVRPASHTIVQMK